LRARQGSRKEPPAPPRRDRASAKKFGACDFRLGIPPSRRNRLKHRNVAIPGLVKRGARRRKVAEKGAYGFEFARCRTEIGGLFGEARGAALLRDASAANIGPVDRRPSAALSRARPRGAGAKFSWLQGLEKSRNRERISPRCRRIHSPLEPRRSRSRTMTPSRTTPPRSGSSP
jgi:hypothetical protein